MKIQSLPQPNLSSASPRNTVALPAPDNLRALFPLSDGAATSIDQARARLAERIANGRGAPIAIVGPCSIHCENAALEYAERLKGLQNRLGDRIQLVMRVYFEKPRTTVGWKGFLYDPDLNGSDDLPRGLARARKLMVEIAELGVPIATEILDPLTAPYLDDCLSWIAIGARTAESQIHRQLASGLDCPVGFKNSTDGSVDIAIHAIAAARIAHCHLGVDESGRVAVVKTPGNRTCHVVLRGGKHGANYDREQVAEVAEQLEKSGLAPRILIDCSHQNSGKDHNNQPLVAREVGRQMRGVHADVMGVMIESHLRAGRQNIEGTREYGVSVTDACIDFATTQRVLEELVDLSETSPSS